MKRGDMMSTCETSDRMEVNDLAVSGPSQWGNLEQCFGKKHWP